MAKNDPTTDDIAVELYTPGVPEGKYDAHVRRLVEADAKLTDEQREQGLHNSVVVTFPKTQTNAKGAEKDAVGKYTRYFQDSAKHFRSEEFPNGLSAHIVESTDQDDNTVNVRFIVKERVFRPRKPVAVEPATEDDSDVPVSSAA